MRIGRATGSSWAAKREWRELGQRYGRPGVHGRDQPPQRLCTSVTVVVSASIPIASRTRSGQRSALALSVE